MEERKEGETDSGRVELIHFHCNYEKTFTISTEQSPTLRCSTSLARQSWWISESAYQTLNTAQRIISEQRSGIVLILTRGQEMDSQTKKVMRFVGRKIASCVFRVLHRQRSGEAGVIFSSNGHDDGTGKHIDISVEVNDELLNLLPKGPFTSTHQMDVTKRQYSHILKTVYVALEATGFSIHNNPTEALQIHCDLRDPDKPISTTKR